MNKYIFAGADASTPLGWFVDQLEGAGFEIKHVDTIGVHYSATIWRWYRNWMANKEKVVAKYGERWFRVSLHLHDILRIGLLTSLDLDILFGFEHNHLQTGQRDLLSDYSCQEYQFYAQGRRCQDSVCVVWCARRESIQEVDGRWMSLCLWMARLTACNRNGSDGTCKTRHVHGSTVNADDPRSGSISCSTRAVHVLVGLYKSHVLHATKSSCIRVLTRPLQVENKETIQTRIWICICTKQNYIARNLQNHTREHTDSQPRPPQTSS